MSESRFAELAHTIASVIDGKTFRFPSPWKHKFKVIEPAIGARLIVQEGDEQEIHEVNLDHVAHCVVAWTRRQDDPEMLLTFRKAREVVETWLAFAQPIEDIKYVRWKGEPGYTWRRLPWVRGDGKTPTWDLIMSKMTNAAAFRQWLGSLFFDEARQHQYVWIHGQGNDGKGSMNDVLADVFKRAYRSKQPPAMGDKFWTYGLVGARLVVFPDCNNQTFTAGGLFKTLTGGDPVDVEAKGKMSFTTRLGCKFLFLSNEKPNISCEDADMRRIIYCEFVRKMRADEKDPHFKKKLWDEAGHFLSRCIAEYNAACPEHQEIERDKEAIEEWVAVGDEKFQVIYDEVLKAPAEIYKSHEALRTAPDDVFKYVTISPRDMQAFLENAFPERREQGQFRDWLYKKYGVQKRRIRRGEMNDFYYIGVQKKLTSEAAKIFEAAADKFARKIVSGMVVLKGGEPTKNKRDE